MKIADKIIILVCDDIRIEVGGKVSLMGVYHDIVVKSFPSTLLKLCIVVILEKVRVEIKTARVTVTFPEEDPKTIDIAPPTEPTVNLTMNITIGGVKLLSKGEASFEIEFNDDKKTKYYYKFNVLDIESDKERREKLKRKKQAKLKDK